MEITINRSADVDDYEQDNNSYDSSYKSRVTSEIQRLNANIAKSRSTLQRQKPTNGSCPASVAQGQ